MPAAALPQLVVLDTETTGLDPERDRIIDIGAVRLGADLEVRDRFVTLVHPGVPIPLFITRLGGIADADVRGAPVFPEAFAALREFAGDAVLVGHNVGFDRDHLAAGARRAGLPPLANTWFDTLEAALLLYPELDRHALAVLAAEFRIERQAHRALPDAETAADVLRRLCARAAGLGAEERALLTAIGWAPLKLLDRFRAAPDQAPRRWSPTSREAPAARFAVLPVEADGWRAELGSARGAARTATRSPRRPGEPGLAARLPAFAAGRDRHLLAAAADDVFRRGGVGLFEAGTGSGQESRVSCYRRRSPAPPPPPRRGEHQDEGPAAPAGRARAAHRREALPPGRRWALLMGRENYICRRRLDEAVAAEGEALPDRERSLALAYLVGRARGGGGRPVGDAVPRLPGAGGPWLRWPAKCVPRGPPAWVGTAPPGAAVTGGSRAAAPGGASQVRQPRPAADGPGTLPPFEDVVIDAGASARITGPPGI